jgi:hypothetical protein
VMKTAEQNSRRIVREFSGAAGKANQVGFQNWPAYRTRCTWPANPWPPTQGAHCLYATDLLSHQKEKPFSVGVASSPSKTNLFGLRARKAATISGKAEVRLLPVLDCKKMFSSSRKMRQRNPSHFGSYIHSLPMGKLFTARAFIGVIGGIRNLSIELLEVTTRNAIYCADLVWL